jgi:hypothetical protein
MDKAQALNELRQMVDEQLEKLVPGYHALLAQAREEGMEAEIADLEEAIEADLRRALGTRPA